MKQYNSLIVEAKQQSSRYASSSRQGQQKSYRVNMSEKQQVIEGTERSSKGSVCVVLILSLEMYMSCVKDLKKNIIAQ